MKGSTIPIRNTERGNKPWLLDLRSVGGKREFFATEQEAEIAREQKGHEVRENGAAALALTTAKREEYLRSESQLAELGATLKQAIDFFAAHHRVQQPKTLGEALDELVKIKEQSNHRDRSLSTFKNTVNLFVTYFGPEKKVSEVHRDNVEGWLYHRGYAPATIKSKRIDLRSFFNSCIARGWTTQNPTEGMQVVLLDDKAPEIFTVEQCERLMFACQRERPEFCTWLALALFCGIRPEEINRLSRNLDKHLNLETNTVEVPASIAKTRQRRLVELNPTARAWVMVSRAAGRRLPNDSRGMLLRIRKAAGFEASEQKMENGERAHTVVEGEPWPHDVLRHCYASYHLAMHGSADKTATQMGHRSTEMLFGHYRELVTKRDAERFWAILPKGTR